MIEGAFLNRTHSSVAGTFITFEGIDGCGKSTQLRLLASALRLKGIEEVVTTREPGGTPLGKRLRAALLDSQEEVEPLAELLLYAADRAQHVYSYVRPALAEGRIVLSDRYSDATAAYQGAGRGFSPEVIDNVIKLATGGLKPELTLLFDLSVAECAERSRNRVHEGSKDRLDSENAAFHTRVRAAYLKIADAEPDRVVVIDASQSIEATHNRVMEIVVPFLEARGFDPSIPREHSLASDVR